MENSTRFGGLYFESMRSILRHLAGLAIVVFTIVNNGNILTEVQMKGNIFKGNTMICKFLFNIFYLANYSKHIFFTLLKTLALLAQSQ